MYYLFRLLAMWVLITPLYLVRHYPVIPSVRTDREGSYTGCHPTNYPPNKLHYPIVSVEQAEKGRTLAATRWMDGTLALALTNEENTTTTNNNNNNQSRRPSHTTSTNTPTATATSAAATAASASATASASALSVCGECHWPWGGLTSIRYGASHDTESIRLSEITASFREYITHKTGKGKAPKRWEEANLAHTKVISIRFVLFLTHSVITFILVIMCYLFDNDLR